MTIYRSFGEGVVLTLGAKAII